MTDPLPSARRFKWVPLLFTVVIIAITVSLGRWQLRRADEKAALEQIHEQARRQAPVRLDGQSAARLMARPGAASDARLPDAAASDGQAGATARADTKVPDAKAPDEKTPGEKAPGEMAQWVGHRVSAEGRYDGRWTVLLDNRTHEGIAGFHVLTPLRLAGSDAFVLVLRGWTPRDPADRLRARPFVTATEPVRISGMAEKDLPQTLQLGHDPVPGPDDRVWQYFDFEKYRRWSGVPVIPMLIREDDGQDDGLVRDWVSPGTDVSRHQAYAFQWFVMAAAAALGWLWYNFGRRRRASHS